MAGNRYGLSIILVAAVVVAAAAGAAAYYFRDNQKTADVAEATPTPTVTATPDPATDWLKDAKVYTNADYGYSIKYPADWKITETQDAQTGAFFTPPGGSDKAVSIISVKKALNLSDQPFAEYAKVAAQSEIEGYGDPLLVSPITTSAGTVGYQTIWNVTQHDGTQTVSLPIAYFEPADRSSVISMHLVDDAYTDLYDAMAHTYANK